MGCPSPELPSVISPPGCALQSKFREHRSSATLSGIQGADLFANRLRFSGLAALLEMFESEPKDFSCLPDFARFPMKCRQIKEGLDWRFTIILEDTSGFAQVLHGFGRVPEFPMRLRQRH